MFQDFLQKSIFISGIVIIRYFILAGFFFSIFYIIFKKQNLIQKIQEKFPSISDYKRDISYSVFSSLIFGVFFTLINTGLKPYTQMYEKISEFGIGYYILSYFLMILIHDTYFYWTHRLIHHPKLFRKVHLVHHKTTNPTPWTSLAFHPWEAFVQALIIPLIVFIIPVQKFALVFYFIFQLAHNIYGHLGYELIPGFIRRSALGKYLNTSMYHNHHHKNFHGNYGLFFTFWDRWMDTLVPEKNMPEKEEMLIPELEEKAVSTISGFINK
ncbi:MAG: sterol desaturase family protein [Bacteroidetes bacterium]|nr:sterol desaturase family protein [Bacteroidota bacterium]